MSTLLEIFGFCKKEKDAKAIADTEVGAEDQKTNKFFVDKKGKEYGWKQSRKDTNETALRKYIKELIMESLSAQDIEDVYATAQLAHLGQKRRSGESYFEHPKQVRDIVLRYYPQDRSAQLLALLHDTVEDLHKQGNMTQRELIEMIRASIHDREQRYLIMRALKLLSHDKAIPYNDYLLSVAENPLALRVKLADMMHNASSAPSKNQLNKYRLGLEELVAYFGGSIPSMINFQHWADLKSTLE